MIVLWERALLAFADVHNYIRYRRSCFSSNPVTLLVSCTKPWHSLGHGESYFVSYFVSQSQNFKLQGLHFYLKSGTQSSINCTIQQPSISNPSCSYSSRSLCRNWELRTSDYSDPFEREFSHLCERGDVQQFDASFVSTLSELLATSFAPSLNPINFTFQLLRECIRLNFLVAWKRLKWSESMRRRRMQ